MKIGIDSYCYHRFFGEVYPQQVEPEKKMEMFVTAVTILHGWLGDISILNGLMAIAVLAWLGRRPRSVRRRRVGEWPR